MASRSCRVGHSSGLRQKIMTSTPTARATRPSPTIITLHGRNIMRCTCLLAAPAPEKEDRHADDEGRQTREEQTLQYANHEAPPIHSSGFCQNSITATTTTKPKPKMTNKPSRPKPTPIRISNSLVRLSPKQHHSNAHDEGYNYQSTYRDHSVFLQSGSPHNMIPFGRGIVKQVI